MAQNQNKKYLSFPLYHRFSISSPSPPLPISFFVAVPSVSLLFIYCFFLGVSLPSSPVLLLPLLYLPPQQSISLQWSGRLTAAPPEEYQSMLLWRQNRAPLLYFPPFLSFHRLGLTCGCSWTEHDPVFVFLLWSVNGSLSSHKVWIFR